MTLSLIENGSDTWTSTGLRAVAPQASFLLVRIIFQF